MSVRMTRRRALQWAGMAVMGGLISACAPGSEATKTPVQSGEPPVEATKPAAVTAAPPELVKLRAWFHWGGALGETAEALVKRYNESQGAEDGIHVDIETVNWSEFRQKVTASRMAGTSPDIYHTSIATCELALNDIAIPLSDSEQEYVRSNYAPAAVERLIFQGKVWGYPTEFQTPALAYRRSFLEKAGISELPATTEELRDLAKELTHEEGGLKYYGYTVWYDNFIAYSNMNDLIWRHGGEMWEFEGDIPRKVKVNTPEAIAGLKWWRDMIDDGSTQVGDMAFGDAWANGLAIMGEVQPFTPISLRDGGQQEVFEDLGITYLRPSQGVDPIVEAHGWSLVMDKQTKLPEKTTKFMQWLMHKPDMPLVRFIVEEVGSLPSATEYPLPIPGWSDAMVQGYVQESVPISRAEPGLKVLGVGEISAALLEMFEAVALKQKEVEPALQELQPILDEILERTDGDRTS